MISIYFKDSVVTTQSRAIIEYLKPKREKQKIFQKQKCVLHLFCRNLIVEVVSREKTFPF